MRPASFDYEAPTSAGEAAELLADPRSMVLAGGQTLVPRLIRREVEPARLVDITRIDGLRYIAAADDGGTRIGPLVSHAEIVRSGTLRARWPLLADACAFVSNPVVRRRGTIGGSLGWGAGRSEVVAALLACDAELVTCSHASGVRRVSVGDALDAGADGLHNDELIVDVRLGPGGGGWGVAEFSPRRWDPALGGAMCRLGAADGAGSPEDVRIVAFGALDRPRRLPSIEVAVAAGAGTGDIAAQTADAVRPFVASQPGQRAAHIAAVIADAAARAVAQARNSGGSGSGV